MKVIIYDKNTKKGQFNNYGLGKLRLINSCKVTEELNGVFGLELILDLEDKKVSKLTKWTIIMVDGQLFRIVNRSDIDKDNVVKIFAKHIFYDINNGFIIDNKVMGKNVTEAMEIAIPSDFKKVFDVSSDITDINSIYFVKNNGAENIFGIIERWGKGELIRDNFDIKINNSKGYDKGVTFTYQKIDAIEVDEDVENVVTRLYPTGKDGIALEEHYITIPGWNEEDYPPFHITKEVKFEGAESTGELRILARKEAERIGLSRTNFKIKVHDLYDTTLAKHIPSLTNVCVGDIVTIKHPKLDIRVKVKCIKKVHEKVTNEITLEFGQPMQSFFDAVDNSNNQVTIPDTTKYEEHMFFYFNDSTVTINKSDSDLCFVRYGVTDTTNLMLYFNLFFECNGNCNVKLILRIDNSDLTFSPEFTFEKGKRNITFTYPMINTEGGKAHTFSARLQFEDGVVLSIPAENIQIAIRGQNVSGSMKVGPHAEVEEIFNLSKVDIKDIKTSSNSFISKIIPKRIKCSEIIDFNKIDYSIIATKSNVEITITKEIKRRTQIDKRNNEVE